MCFWNTNAPDDGQFQLWPRSQEQIPSYQYKNLVIRNAHVQCKISNIHFLLWKMFIFKKMSQIWRPKVLDPTNRSYQKVHSCEVWNFCLTRLKFSENGSNSKVKVTGWKILVTSERSCHKEHSCKTSNL